MASKIKFKRGRRSRLPQKAEPGEIMVCTDTCEVFTADQQGNPVSIASRRKIDAGTFGDPVGEEIIVYDGGTF